MATVIISSELMEALEDRLKAQAETITRLTAELEQCKHALDDEGDKITFAQFVSATGRHPTQDDMDRVNCANVGEIGHHNCGWCRICNKPRFEVSCGHEAVMIVATKQAEQ